MTQHLQFTDRDPTSSAGFVVTSCLTRVSPLLTCTKDSHISTTEFMEAGFGTKTTTPTEVTGMAEVGNMPTPAVLDVQKATFDQTVWNFVKQIWRSEASTL